MTLERQLLHCVRSALQQAMAAEEASHRENLLGQTDLLINELLLRQDRGNAFEHYKRGSDLASQGLAQLAAQQLPLDDIESEYAGLSTAVSDQSGAELLESQTAAVGRLLQKIVARLPAKGSEALYNYLDAVCDWEVDIWARPLQEAPAPEGETIQAADITGSRFEEYLRHKFPEWGEINVTYFYPLPGGFNNQTILVNVEDSVHGPRELVIRAQQPTDSLQLYINHVVDELPILQLAWQLGVKVAEPLWAERDASLLGTTFLVSRKAPGRNLGTAVGATEEITDTMLRSLVSNVHKVHQIDLEAHRDQIKGTALEQWQTSTIEESIRKDIAFWRANQKNCGIDNSPLIERGFKWLEENVPACDEKPVLLHADYGLHNILIDGEEVSAILDWEVCHIGDPAGELAWLLSGTDQYSSAEQLLQYYVDAGGEVPSEFRMRYHDVFACLWVPIACAAAANLIKRRHDDIRFPILALRLRHHNSSRLNACIARAEAVKYQC